MHVILGVNSYSKLDRHPGGLLTGVANWTLVKYCTKILRIPAPGSRQSKHSMATVAPSEFDLGGSWEESSGMDEPCSPKKAKTSFVAPKQVKVMHTFPFISLDINTAIKLLILLVI